MLTPRVKLADVAKVVGVSTATVSRVVNGKPGVAEATRTAVLAGLETLGYRSDHPQGIHEGLIAVMVPELGNPTFGSFANELVIQLAAADRRMVLCTSGPGGTSEDQYLDLLAGVAVDGLISVSGTAADTLGTNDHYQRLLTGGMPTVFINAYDATIPGAFFNTSDAEAISQSVGHLRRYGHTRIGLALGQQRYLPAQRKAEAFLALGLPADSIVSTIFSIEGGQAAAARLLDAGHTAIVCGSDVMALGAIREVRSRGLDVPDDISIVGYDDSALMPFTSPALTTVRQPIAALCQAAVEALLSAMAGAPADAAEMLFHPDLIIRRSTGPVHDR